MYWIASYPRSGNTFLRILFKEVYGIYTWEGYGEETPQKVLDHNNNKDSKLPLFIKTHELPNKTQITHENFKTIYLVRDGRDAAVSLSYHRCNIVKPGSDFMFNLRTTIMAPFGTSFGGWSKHVKLWSAQADIVIKFEELISNPIKVLKKLEAIIDLPKADYSKIPTFKDLKNKKYSLGSGNSSLSEKQQQQRRENFFRSGKTNEWKTTLPRSLISIFNYKHGKMLQKLGYSDISKDRFIFMKLIQNYYYWFIGFLNEKLKKSKSTNERTK